MKKPELKIDEYGSKRWYLNGKRHRIDGPAVEYTNGYKAWYFNDKKHRIDGPAIERSDGTKIWFLNNKEVKKEDIIDFNPKITEREYIKFIISL